MIDVVIHNQKSVVDVMYLDYVYRIILTVVLHDFQFQLRRKPACTDCGCNSVDSFRQHDQHTFVYVIIYKYNPSLS